MAISGNTVWEVQTGGNDTNGGGFVAGATGTDFSLIGTARPNGGTDGSSVLGVGNGTTTFVCADAQFTAAIVGNIIYLVGGTGTLAPVRREVKSRSNATTVVLDAAVAAGTGITLNIGGALASPGEAGKFKVASNKIFIKSGTYVLTNTTANTSGGPINDTTGGAIGSYSMWIGYNTNRFLYNTDTKPIIQVPLGGAVTGITIVTLGVYCHINNITVDGNAQANIYGILVGVNARGLISFCKATGTTVIGITVGNLNTRCICCEVSNFSGTVGILNNTTSPLFGCVVHDGTAPGISLVAVSGASYCIVYNLSGATSDGFTDGGAQNTIVGCVAALVGRDGFRLTSSSIVINSLSEGNLGYGFNGIAETQILNCGTFNNTSGATNGINAVNIVNFINNIVATFFVNAAAGNFALANTVQGQLAKAAGVLGVFPGGLTQGYQDIGAVQHQDSPNTNIFVIDD